MFRGERLRPSSGRDYIVRPSAPHGGANGGFYYETTVRAGNQEYLQSSAPALRDITTSTISRVSRSPSTRRRIPSLADLAIVSFLQHTELVDPDTLVGLPYHGVGDRLWRQVEKLELTSPKLFYAFCRAFPEEEEVRYYRFAEITPRRAFAAYIDLLNSPAARWEVALTVSRLALARADVLSLHRLSNVVALDLCSGSSQEELVDDYLLRAWARQADECGAWGRLRVLLLRNQRHITAASVRQLSRFRGLRLVGVKGCDLGLEDAYAARALGWTTEDHKDVLKDIRRDVEKSHTWDGMLKACVKHSAQLADDDEDIDSTHPQQQHRHGTVKGECGAVDDDKIALPHAQPSEPPLLSYRLGSTSNDVLFTNVFDPIVFLRLDTPARRQQHRRAPIPVPSPSPSSSFPTTQHVPMHDPISRTSNSSPLLSTDQEAADPLPRPKTAATLKPKPIVRPNRYVTDLLAEFSRDDVEAQRVESKSH